MANGSAEVALRRLERLPITNFHYKLAAVLSIAFFFDLADLNTFGSAAPALMKYWHINAGVVSQVISSGFLGMFFGALVGGWIADVLGRRVPFMWSLLLYSLCSFGNAFAQSASAFLLIRFLTGFFLAIVLVVAQTIISEMFPSMKRGQYQALVLGVGAAGITVMSFYSRWVVGLGPDGWRWIFIGGSVGVFGFVLSIFWLKESPRWYVSKGLVEKADPIIIQIETEAKLPKLEIKDVPLEHSITKSAQKASIKELFKKGQSRTTILFAIVWMFDVVAFYGFQAWIPTLLYSLGITLTKSLLFAAVMMIGSPLGAFAGMPISDLVGRKTSLIIAICVCIVLGVLLGVSRAPWAIMLLGFLMAFALQNHTTYLYAYTPENFPTNIRTAGTGLCNGLGRLANVFGPLLIGYILIRFGYLSVFIFIGLLFVIEAAIIYIWGAQTKGRTLEEITGFKSSNSVSEQV